MRPGSFIYYLWQKPPLAVIMSLYIFNITNAEAFLNGIDKKLKVVEVGPYVYQEFLENKNATFHENGTLSYVPTRYTVPIPERSVGDPHKDIVIVANLPLLGLSSAASKVSPLAALAASSLAKSTSSQTLLNLTVHDFLWGYEDNLVTLANTILPDYITFKKFGLMERLFDEGHNTVTMNLPKAAEKAAQKLQSELKSAEVLPVSSAQVSDQVLDVEYEDDYEVSFNGIESLAQKTPPPPEKSGMGDYSIDTWNGSPGLHYWGYDDATPEKNSPCNTLQGSYDGTMFPKNMSKTETFKVYRKAFCRTLPIEFSHTGTEYGVDAYWFKLADNAFDDSLGDPDTMCYCSKDKTCMKKGLGNITPCYYNIPVSVSLPHFYNSDPSLVHEVEGINPIKEKHESIIIMQPRLGVPMKVFTRMQVNLMNGETRFNSNVKAFDHLTLPVFWVQIAIEKLTPQLDVILYMAFNALPVAQNVIICLLMLAGVSCLAVTLFFCLCFNVSLEQSNMKFNSRKSIKYSSVSVFPFIKREIAKFEDRERDVVLKVESV